LKFGSSLPPAVCRMVHVLLTLFENSPTHTVLCYVFALFFFVLCDLWCHFLFIVYFSLFLWYILRRVNCRSPINSIALMLFCNNHVVSSNIFYELKLFEIAFISWLLIYCKSPLIIRCYEFSNKKMFGSSLPPAVCRMVHVLLTLFENSPTHTVLCYVLWTIALVFCVMCNGLFVLSFRYLIFSCLSFLRITVSIDNNFDNFDIF
jgi:phage shock protein PspC (stress-responsive transcriptional regulator)